MAICDKTILDFICNIILQFLIALDTDHTSHSLQDLLERYRPSVPKSMYSFNFVPVIDGDEIDDAVTALRREPPSMSTVFERGLEHELRVPRYCWCDSYALSALQHGIVHRFFVIEVTLAPWDPAAPDAAPLADAAAPEMWPVFQNEDGDVYVRRNASTDRFSLRSVEQMTEQACLLT